jgi:hypothetical protein
VNHPSAPYEFIGPGMPRRYYLDQLTTTGYTGWYDRHGNPAPWPEDFTAPDSGWQPTTGGDSTSTDPDQPF